MVKPYIMAMRALEERRKIDCLLARWLVLIVALPIDKHCNLLADIGVRVDWLGASLLVRVGGFCWT